MLIYNEDLHFEHKQWNRELNFWQDELRTFQNRLDELVTRWTDTKVLSELDQYQNRFFIHKTKIEELKEDIQAHELNIAKHLEIGENAIDRIYYKGHLEFRERMETQRDLYYDQKKSFYKFLSKYM